MRFILDPVHHQFQGGELAYQDYFDHRGALLLGKGQEITPSLAAFFNEQDINSLYYEWTESCNCLNDDSYASVLLNFPLTAPWLHLIYCETSLFRPELFFQAVNFIDQLIEHLSDLSSDFELLRTSKEITYKHSVNVALLSYIIGKAMNFKGEKLRRLVLSALLHDIGKLDIPNEILNKPGALNLDEFAIIQTHPTRGVERTSNFLLPEGVLTAILQHHERWNGSGYPQGLAEKKILPSAQIIAIADVFDALTTDRPYHAALPPYHALEILLKGSGTDFSPKVIQAFLSTVQLYPANSLVTLNSGERGVVLQFSYPNLTQPIIQILFDSDGNSIEKKRVVDLSKDSSHFILTIQYRGAR
ncbi:HD-GYP domain-containing protein [Desulfitobacterium sp.]|uniref:HD-GYP domain-containing protein n=1 Tax=Desulfitobacterium sp. TaxID=49981 RepID=UPI002C977AC5|nr:HD-GYP domain-containing protein [Desulfitobacterium sp.]HVJ49879.1 HD-GYP domain-containing protein [Desulfitobacterium sp.]